MGHNLLQRLDNSFIMGELGDWNFWAGDLFLSQHWFLWCAFQFQVFGNFALYSQTIFLRCFMRSSLTATTLSLLLGMFFFQGGCSSSQQPDKQSLQQKNEEITSKPMITAQQSIEPPSALKLASGIPNITDQQSIEPNQQLNSFTNCIGIKLMPIPKGKFMMGSPETEKERGKFGVDETQHEVTISQNFYMGATEVTQAQWQKVMGNKPSFFKGDELPVEKVGWDEAVEFCKRLSEMPEEKKAGRKYRLPTEAEWEYACRAGTTTPFHFGSELNGRQANCNGSDPYGTNTKGPNLEKTTPVGKYPANAWGLYDMHGNVWEWCSDWYGVYPTGSVTDPIGPATGSFRSSRGGSWIVVAWGCRSAYHIGFGPSDRYSILGFRVALSSSGIPK
jgi:formylglycine-generating enzyme required for sulfatase activity